MTQIGCNHILVIGAIACDGCWGHMSWLLMIVEWCGDRILRRTAGNAPTLLLIRS
ncbi:MAG: hypothetical protein ACFCU5_19795 [Pleurocapsa sp.]